MNAFATDDDALAAFVAQLLDTTFTLMTMVDQMTRFAASGRSSPDAPPVPEVLSNLLRDVLPALLANHSRTAIEDAATLLADTTGVICREIYTVSLDPPPERPRRPARSASRRRRPR